MRVGTVQMHNTPGDKERNIERMLESVRRGIELELDLLCFPELAVTGYRVKSPSLDALRDEAEKPDGPTAGKLMGALRGARLVVAYGFPEKASDKPYNSYVFLSADGIVHLYRKTHLALCADHHESDLFAAGDELSVFDLKGTCCGAVVCWDGFFPETTRVLALKGAELIVWALAGLGRGYLTQTTAPVRAMDNGVFLIVSAMAGPFGEYHFDGGAGIFDRNGKALAKAAKDAEEMVWAEIDTASAKAPHQRRRLTERRPELYGPLTQTKR